jgi:hypothetical protein
MFFSSYLQGIALSMELGHMKAVIIQILDKNQAESNFERQKQRYQTLIEKIDAVPMEVRMSSDVDCFRFTPLSQNSDEVDFVALLHEIRSLYRSLGPIALPFERKSQETFEW